ncbi:MAG TPA: multicopper oxidase domain-containing protein [Propionibacteriaceae bacterium]|nr:multicopper oxidase domain-containing protein [Propionibacteriaceae bacterium]
MYVVREGDIVIMRIENHSGRVHPMHLHTPPCRRAGPQRGSRHRQPVVD